jgi:hypothetical protein
MITAEAQRRERKALSDWIYKINRNGYGSGNLGINP